MVKIDTNGSGISVLITGCPFCDGDDGEHYLQYHGHTIWVFNSSVDVERYSIRVKYCPYCGKLLPSLYKWVVKEG